MGSASDFGGKPESDSWQIIFTGLPRRGKWPQDRVDTLGQTLWHEWEYSALPFDPDHGPAKFPNSASAPLLKP